MNTASVAPPLAPAAVSVVTHRAARDCLHCGQALADQSAAEYCCLGCEAVAGALRQGDLLHYYDLRGERAEPVGDLRLERRDGLWIEPIAQALAQRDQPMSITLAVQGLRCAACVWLIQELFARVSDGDQLLVNVGRGSLELHVGSTFPLRRFIGDVERFGYLIGPSNQAVAPPSDDLLVRLGVCAALAANTMMFSIAVYLGLPHGPLRSLLHTLSFGLTSLAVLIGAPVFVRSAWHAIRARVLHLDVPIAAGIVLTYAAACWSFATGATEAAYYDSLSTFIALMLLGRFLQTRIVHANQSRVLQSGGAEAVMTRRLDADVVSLVSASALREGDQVLIGAGDLLPVRAMLVSDEARCSLDWITGESDPVTYVVGATLPAGAFNVGDRAFVARALEPFADSALRQLLAAPDRDATARNTRRGHAFARVYVPSVIVAAAAGLAYWWWRTGNLEAGLSVATAVCVVTCPCAIGIATPLAHDLVLGRLRRAGLFVRSATLLDRLTAVTRVVFDKTGTLTTGRLRVAEGAPLDQLSANERDVLYTMCASSVHPKSVAIHRALHERGGKRRSDVVVTEHAGRGLSATRQGHEYRLGRRDFVTGAGGDALCFGADGVERLRVDTVEDIRHDSADQLRLLRARGYDTWILSGDQPTRVRALAGAIDVRDDHAIGGQSPDDKAKWIAAHDHRDTLMIGDGINDSLAVREAFCSGTPSIDRAFMPGRTDFYFVTAGLAPITLALSLSHRLARVTRINQVFAVAYNVGTVGLSLAGVMRPWLAAVLMPLSSLLVLAWTSALLSEGAWRWKR